MRRWISQPGALERIVLSVRLASRHLPSGLPVIRRHTKIVIAGQLGAFGATHPSALEDSPGHAPRSGRAPTG